jgi:hypothetical protein
MTSKGEFILKYLDPLYPNGDYGLHMFERWAQFKPQKAGSYKNFRMAISKLRDDGKIEVYYIEPRTADRNNSWDAKRYYRVVK